MEPGERFDRKRTFASKGSLSSKLAEATGEG